ncbi:hypothetical protein BISA_2286 [Bifidobacterium saguini DSM 23967]|uniref:Polysaccharide pyruvyl transferase domain-containing protein n=2 Tax=Bifidobacterium saguini TaxID=762210 RepID=A0A087D7X1_9BIFI|nr:polysaccharide pyruvyl transferase family protein [Bifidobacterium saguini]KFI91621.1 hypothetical protein BISA_2286 [Bifidobacterium saguini DSM 23967]QTB90241.1 polysaccharide pyruvyl transferase family protein [Bifidobacterium saguini]
MDKKHSLWILTINDNANYGNRLQNYALQEVLRTYACEVSTLHCAVQSSNCCVAAVKNILRPIKRFIREHKGAAGALQKKRRKNFESFTNQFVNDGLLSLTPGVGFSRHLSGNERFIIGSDQVWNDRLVKNDMLEVRLGSLFPEHTGIAYAASFGISQVSESSSEAYAQFLPRLSAISVREDQGALLVRELSGQPASVVLDPTLMLTSTRWNDIIPGNYIPKDERYVLTYFLGKPSLEQDKVIQQYAKKHGYKIRRMLDISDPETYVVGPREFVEMFSKSQFVFTDSYHACCFSIIFNKQFKVFNRTGFSGTASMNSRMQTLFRLFELNDMMDDDTRLDPVDYTRVNDLLEQHRRESRRWLDDALAKIGISE